MNPTFVQLVSIIHLEKNSSLLTLSLLHFSCSGLYEVIICDGGDSWHLYRSLSPPSVLAKHQETLSIVSLVKNVTPSTLKQLELTL